MELEGKFKLIDEAFNHAGGWDTMKEENSLFDLAVNLAKGSLAGKKREEFLLNLTGRTQSSVNFEFLMNCIDQIHDALCPGHIGTWQQRAEEAVGVAQLIHEKLRNIEKIIDDLLGGPETEQDGAIFKDSIG